MEPRSNTYIDLHSAPALVRVWGPKGEIPLSVHGEGWEGGGVVVSIQKGIVRLSSEVELLRLQLRWRNDLSSVTHVLGDHWERSYADLAWRGKEGDRPLPWYCLAFDGHVTHGYGVETGPGAMCFWTLDAEGLSLWCDLRSGGSAVQLGQRTLTVCHLVSRSGREGESSFAAQKAFCAQMCPKPLLAKHTLYGTNDWDFAYGNNSRELIEGVSRTISDLSPSTSNRPYSVIDDGWSQGGLGHGPWLGNDKFGDMGKMAERMKALGVRPGLWFRPLTPIPGLPESLRAREGREYLDPTLPEVREHVVSHMKRFAGWGYEMVKHDFTSFDLFGRWGMQMGAHVTGDGWHFHDRSKTNAEIVLDLYHAIREGAGDIKLLGCNTFSHLAAGIHEAQRTGDDTSGVSWERTRRMGINTLAFRAAQHNTFYGVDPDIVAVTKAIPWELTEQWLRLVAMSGTMLFLSVEPDFLTEDHRRAIRLGLEQAAFQQPIGEPLDWLSNNSPAHWKLMGKDVRFHWGGAGGPNPFEG